MDCRLDQFSPHRLEEDLEIDELEDDPSDSELGIPPPSDDMAAAFAWEEKMREMDMESTAKG